MEDETSMTQRPNTLVRGHSDWSSTIAIASMIRKDDHASNEQSREQAEAASQLSYSQGLTSIKGNSRRRRETALKKEKGCDLLAMAENMETRSADRRTVIWHAMDGVLDQAGVKRRFFHKEGRLCRHRRDGERAHKMLGSPGHHPVTATADGAQAMQVPSGGGNGADGNDSASEASKSSRRRRSRCAAADGSVATPSSVATDDGVADAETARAALLIQRRLRTAAPRGGAARSEEERGGEVARGSV